MKYTEEQITYALRHVKSGTPVRAIDVFRFEGVCDSLP